jgi:signal transduction histidine kinase
VQLSGTIPIAELLEPAELLDLRELLLEAIAELLDLTELLLKAVTELLDLTELLLKAVAELLDLAELLLEAIAELLKSAIELLEPTATVPLLDTIAELLSASPPCGLSELKPIKVSGFGIELQAKNKNTNAKTARKSNIFGKYVRIFIPPEWFYLK